MKAFSTSTQLGLLVCAVCFSLAACTKPDIHIGFVGQLSGRYSDLGVQGRNGAQLAVELINTSGEFDGRSFKLIARDDKNSPERALSLDRELIEAGVVAIIGHMTSPLSLAVHPLIQETETVLLSPTTSTPMLSGIDDYFFRVHPASDRLAQAFGHYASVSLELGTLVSIWDRGNLEYAQPYKEHFLRGFVGTGKSEIESISFSDFDDPLFREELDALSELEPDGVLLVASARETAAIVQILRSTGCNARILSSGWAATSAFPVYAGAAGEGVYLEETGNSSVNEPAYLDFTERYRRRFGMSPSFSAVRSYDAVMVLSEALKKTRGRKSGLKEALLSIGDVPGLYGPISFDSYGDTSSILTILQVQDGTLEPVDRIRR